MRVPGYTIERELARGGMGVVYSARQEGTGRAVALKVLLAPEEASSEEVARFAREAQATARLRHEHIVGVHELVQVGRSPVIVMDLIEGETLRERIRREGPLPAEEAARLAEALARALDHAHERGVLHRDVKPDNVLLGDSGRPLLTDFGVAKLMEGARERLTHTGEIMGTLAFMSPEQANGGSLDERADVYSLGATLYVMLTGAPPFTGSTAVNLLNAVFSQPPVPPGQLAEVPPDLEAICLQCLAKDAQERYPSAAALGDDLARYQAGDLVVAQRGGRWSGLRRAGRRHRLALLATCAALAAALVAIFWRPAESGPPRANRPAAPRSTPDAPRAPTAAELEVAAKARFAARDWAGAIERLDRALQQTPDSVPLLELRGEARLRSGDPAGGREDFTRALKRAPRQRIAALLAKRAETWRREQRWERGLADARQALKRDRRCLKAYLELAWIQVRPPVLYSARTKQGIEAAHTAKGIEPDAPEVVLLDVFVRTYIRAASLAQTQAQINAERPGELTEGAQTLSRLLGKHPEFGEAYGLRFLIRREQKDHKGALADLSRWLALDPYARTAERYRDQAVLALELKQYPRALNSANASLAKGAEAGSYVVRARIHQRRGSDEEALVDLGRALELDPRCLSAYEQRCWIRARRREAKLGLPDATRLIELATRRLEEKGLDHFTRATVRFQLAMGYRLRAQFHLLLKRPRQALADLDAVLKRPHPSLRVVVSLERGNVRAMLGDRRGARADYRRALREIQRQPNQARLRGIREEIARKLELLRD